MNNLYSSDNVQPVSESLTCLCPGFGTCTSEQSLRTDGGPNSLTLIALINLLLDMSLLTQALLYNAMRVRNAQTFNCWTVKLYPLRPLPAAVSVALIVFEDSSALWWEGVGKLQMRILSGADCDTWVA